MSYDPKMMFGDIAPVSEPSNTPWFKCEGCSNEYASAVLAKGCQEAHIRHGRKPTTMFPDVPKQAPLEVRRKSEVFWIDNTRAICGLCSSKDKESELLLRVEMYDPPICCRCNKQIEPEPEHLIANPNFLPPSERYDIKRLALSRSDKNERFRRDLHKQLRDIAGRTIAGDLPAEEVDLQERAEGLDTRLEREFGPYRLEDDPLTGLRRGRTGYVGADPDAEPVEKHWGPR